MSAKACSTSSFHYASLHLPHPSPVQQLQLASGQKCLESKNKTNKKRAAATLQTAAGHSASVQCITVTARCCHTACQQEGEKLPQSHRSLFSHKHAHTNLNTFRAAARGEKQNESQSIKKQLNMTKRGNI